MNADLWFWLLLVSATVAVGLIIVLVMQREKEKPPQEEPSKLGKVQTEISLPQTVQKSISTEVISEAKEKLRLLDVEREILSDAVRRLYEASAVGKITEAERDQLLQKYSMDLSRIKQGIEKGETIVALNQLEKVRDELIKMFTEQFEEINKKIEDLRQKIGLIDQSTKEAIASEIKKELGYLDQLKVQVEPQEESKEEKAEEPKQPNEKPAETKKKAIKSKPSHEQEAGEAEKKVEQILADVEKVLKKLNKMEVEE
ncbi:hypothetical protein KEJ18_00580 [Candidatus Bathyarchaeota archaeon]|nr:hypothetical protein [Candidatus Bathyarchaeota archaeon]